MRLRMGITRRKTIALLVPVALLALAALVAAPTFADEGRSFRATLTGYEEVPSVSTAASGSFRAQLSTDGTTLSYELTYGNIQNAVAAHIHLGQPGVIGGVSAFLCGGGGQELCPLTGGTVTGMITAANVTGPAVQGIAGIAAGEFDELVAAMRAGFTYANVHTSTGGDSVPTGPGDLPVGEIRGQIK